MVQPADPRFFELQPPQLFGLVGGDLADAFNGLAAVFEPALGELLESVGCRLDRLVDGLEDPPGAVTRLARGGDERSAPQLREDFLNYLANGRFCGLHICLASL